MKRHLSFVAALGLCFYAMTVAGHGQEVKTAREAAVLGDGNSSTSSASSWKSGGARS